jgi:hypothetical protein
MNYQWHFKWGGIRIMLDGDKISNHFVVKPVFYFKFNSLPNLHEANLRGEVGGPLLCAGRIISTEFNLKTK